MSVATTSKPRFARFIACVAGPVPRSRIRTPRRRCAFRARSMSASRAGLYQGSVATSEVAYTFSQSPVGPVAPGGSTMPRAARGLAKALCLHLRSPRWLPDSRGVRSWGGAYRIRRLVRGRLEKPLDPPRVVDVHRQGGGLLAEPGHAHDVAREDHEESRARGRPDPSDLERPSGRRAERVLVVAQAELGLRDADREPIEACVLEPLEIVQGRGIVLHVGRTVDGGGHLRDLFFERILVLVHESDRMRRGVGRFEDEPREGFAARAAVPMAGVRRRADADVLAMVDDRIDLPVCVRREPVHRDDRRHAERLEDLQVGVEVREAGSEGFEVLMGEGFLLHAAVVLERAHAHDEDRGVRSQSALAAHEVHELLATEIGAESGLRDDDVPETEGDPVRQDAAVPVRDVRERPAVDERGRALEGLHQVRHERVLQQDRGGSMHVQVAHAHRLFAAPTAWMSPVKWRLISSMGRIWDWPPPVAPPFVPKTGPRDGSRTATIAFVPMRFRAWPRPTVVSVFPSP